MIETTNRNKNIFYIVYLSWVLIVGIIAYFEANVQVSIVILNLLLFIPLIFSIPFDSIFKSSHIPIYRIILFLSFGLLIFLSENNIIKNDNIYSLIFYVLICYILYLVIFIVFYKFNNELYLKFKETLFFYFIIFGIVSIVCLMPFAYQYIK